MADNEKTNLFALVGKNISYSFSRGYFAEKFTLLELKNHDYINFDIDSIDQLPSKLDQYKKSIKGLNVTIPYKQDVFKYLDKVNKKAVKIGAVNTIKITKKGKLKGYNTDYYGFKNSITPLLKPHHKKALILGTGGASKAVAYALKKMNIEYRFVSRNPKGPLQISYNSINSSLLEKFTVLINCTPLGTHPNVNECPDIPYSELTSNHLLYDLIYNPALSLFLEKGKMQGATVKNGYEMLELQAEKAWEIWNK